MNISNMIRFRHIDQGMNNFSIAHETIIRLIGTTTTIFGETLTPFVSSSKNLKRPALDAGNGLLFFSANESNTRNLA